MDQVSGEQEVFPRRRLDFSDEPSASNDQNNTHPPCAHKSPFSPHNNISTPPIRGSVSSRASEMGRRMAQERSRNHELIQRIHELENTLSLLQGEGNDGDILDKNYSPHRGFSSPPVTTPMKTPIRDEGCRAMNDDLPSIHIRELEDALKLETKLREAAEKKAADLLQSNTKTGSDISTDSRVEKLLEQAANLISESDSPQSTIYDTKTSNTSAGGGLPLTQERMHEYHELVTAFFTEQQSNGEIDGEEMMPREDILWLLQELKWRFEDILNGYLKESSMKKHESQPNLAEWKECIKGLVELVEKTKVVKSTPPNNEHDNTQILQNEVSSLNQRLDSFATQHKETCRSLYDDMEAMKRNYQEQLANKSQYIQDLESKISEQEEHVNRIQKNIQKDEQWIQHEKQKLELSKEGNVARIRYLEGMLTSLQTQLKESKEARGYRSSYNSTPPRSHGQDGMTKREGNTERSAPPVYMRNLQSAMQHVDLEMQHETTALKPRGSLNDADTTKPDNSSSEITALREQVASLSSSLAESETKRAILIDDFQQERKQYMMQYKQMSDILKQLIEEGRLDNHSTT